MEQRKHTEGPWEVETEGDRFVSVVDAETLTLQIAAVNEKRPREVWLANARLIAAAPELLAALKRMTHMAEATLIAAEKKGVHDKTGIKWCAEARAAIAKAEQS